MNKVVLIGNIVKDPDLRFTPSTGNAVTTVTLAINDGFGEKKKTYYIPVVIWGKTAEAVANNCVKGSKLGITGKITTRSYDAKDGTKRYITEVVADMVGGVEFLSPKNSNNTNTASYDEGWNDPIDDSSEIPF